MRSIINRSIHAPSPILGIWSLLFVALKNMEFSRQPTAFDRFAYQERRADYRAVVQTFLVMLAGAVIVVCISKDIARVGLRWDWITIRLAYLPLAMMASFLPRKFPLIERFIPEFALWVSGSYIVWFCTKFSFSQGYLKSDYVSGIFQFYLAIALMPISRRTFVAFLILSSVYYFQITLGYMPAEYRPMLGLAIGDYLSFALFSLLIFFITSHIRRQKILLKFELCQNIENQKNLISDQAEALSKAKVFQAIASVTQMLSHDLRAPLGTFEKLLLTPDDKIPAMKGAVRVSLNRLYSMIESLRYAETENIIKRQQVMLDFKFGAESLQAKAEHLHIDLLVPESPTIQVYVDPSKVERAWINLVSNALDFARSEVTVDFETCDTQLYIRVIDDGPGVPDQFKPLLFQRGATFGKVGGTGLGLAYVRQVMQGHGGDVNYYRNNSHTVFECRIPDAVIIERAADMSDSPETNQIAASKRVVAICLYPPQLSHAVLTSLAACASAEYCFSGDRCGADFVVSNIDEVMFEVLEVDFQECIQVSSLRGDESKIIDLLKRRFRLDE